MLQNSQANAGHIDIKKIKRDFEISMELQLTHCTYQYSNIITNGKPLVKLIFSNYGFY